ncbi:4766_t:CDS:1, partial [Paraglomus occultum]
VLTETGVSPKEPKNHDLKVTSNDSTLSIPGHLYNENNYLMFVFGITRLFVDLN